MKKLIELLNEYEETKIHIGEKGVWRNNMVWKDGKFRPVSDRYPSNYMTQYYLISKEYGFIKWLVDNDKINTVLFANELNKVVYLSDFVFRNDEGFNKTIYKQLLMILSIQDNPIEFLISILK